MNPRLFVALGFGPSILQPMLAARPAPAEGVRVEPAENLHLTLHFLGSRPLDAVAEALARVRAAPVSLRLAGLGSFEGRDRDDILWAAVDGGPALAVLHREIAASLATIGFEPEARPWQAHVTLARCRPGHHDAVERYLAQTPPTGEERVTAFRLYTSDLGSGRPVYRVEREYPLAGLA
jgi:2'-5' RNA ligase